MAYPVYEGNGGIADGDGSVNVPYPSTVNANDILIITMLDADADTFTTPSGWTEIYQEGAETNASVGFFWKRAAGTESGTQTVESADTAGQAIFGIMARFSNCRTTGNPFEDVTGTAVTQTTTPTIPALTSQGTERLAVCFIGVEDDTTLTGATDYTEAYQATSTAGGDANLACFYQEISSAGAVGSDELALDPTEYTGNVAFLLVSTTGATNHTLNIDDTVYFSDTVAKDIGKSLSDTVYLSESISKNVGIYADDTVYISDEVLKNIGLSVADIVYVSDLESIETVHWRGRPIELDEGTWEKKCVKIYIDGQWVKKILKKRIDNPPDL